MRVLVCGSREWLDADKLGDVLTSLRPDEVIHGYYRGADTMADWWARSNGVKVTPCPADWVTHGLAAGPIRNQQMVDMKPDLVLAFGDGRGTRDCVKRAEKAGVPVRRIYE